MIDRRQTLAAAAAVAGLLVGRAKPASAASAKTHRVAMHVDDNDAERMTMALNNARNVIEAYSKTGEAAEIEIVAYGPGLHMLRADTSPVKEQLKGFLDGKSAVSFAACANTMAGMKKREGHDIELIASPRIRVVPAGVVQLVERQEQGWSYIKP
jgi:uncharacterized protein